MRTAYVVEGSVLRMCVSLSASQGALNCVCLAASLACAGLFEGFMRQAVDTA